MKHFAFLIWLLAASIAAAQPKAVLTQADMGTFTVVRTDGSQGSVLDLFAVPASASFLRFNDYTLDAAGKPQLRPVAILPKGTACTVVLVAAEVQGDAVVMVREVLAVGGDAQPNPPQPPTPTPVPVPGDRWVVVIEESSARTPQQFAVVQSPLVRQYVSQTWGEGRYRVLEADQPAPAGFAPILDACRDKPLPVVVVADHAGAKVVDVRPLPDTAAELLDWLKRYGGTK